MNHPSRRNLLRGQWRTSGPIRPPWAWEEARFTQQCTRCDACVKACETGVLIRGSGGFPECDFQKAECTFCQQCVSSCQADAFQSPSQLPWQQMAHIGAQCLTLQGVECRSCQDNCEPGAIRFRPRVGGVARPELQPTHCNGCGACVRGCPVQAITVSRGDEGE